MLLFEWDTNKARKNLRKHKVSFEEAMTIFYDPLSAAFDDPVRRSKILRITKC